MRFRLQQLRRNAGKWGVVRAGVACVGMLAAACGVVGVDPTAWSVPLAWVAGALLPMLGQRLLVARPDLTHRALQGWAAGILVVAVLGRRLVADGGWPALALVVGFVMAYLSAWALFLSHPEIVRIDDEGRPVES